MSPCLRPDEFIDALDGALPPARRAHVDDCAACRATLADVTRAALDAATDEVPEPPASFWPALNARVRAATREAPHAPHAMSRAWTEWRRAAVLGPLAGLAVLIVVLVVTVARDRSRTPELDAAAGIAAEGAGRDAGPALGLVMDLASTLDEDVDPLGLEPMPDLGEAAAASLSVDEQEALRVLLRAAVERPPS